MGTADLAAFMALEELPLSFLKKRNAVVYAIEHTGSVFVATF